MLNVARCSAETLSDGDAILECPVPTWATPCSATDGITRTTSTQTGTGAYATRVRLARSASVDAERKAANIGATCVPKF